MRRIAASLIPLVLVSGLIAADDDGAAELVQTECDNEVIAQGETDEFTIQAAPLPFPQQNGPRDPADEPFYSSSVVQFEGAYTNDVDALRGIATITFDWDSPAGAASDIDIYVFDSSGGLVTESTGDNTTGPAGEQVMLSFVPCETYTFDVQNWAAINAPEVTVTTTVEGKYPRR